MADAKAGRRRKTCALLSYVIQSGGVLPADRLAPEEKLSYKPGVCGMWLEDILELFGGTLEVMMEVSELRFFLTAPLFLVVFALLANLVRRGGRGKL